MTNHSSEKRKTRYKKFMSKPNKYELAALFLSAAFIYFFILITGSCEHDKYPTKETPYNSCHEDIQNAVTAYASENNGSIPTLNRNYTNSNCANCNVINMSALLFANGGMMRDVPDGIWQGSDAMDDNCDSSGGHISGCSASNHYIWIVDEAGTVYSYCAGDGCSTNNSGYQGVWP